MNLADGLSDGFLIQDILSNFHMLSERIVVSGCGGRAPFKIAHTTASSPPCVWYGTFPTRTSRTVMPKDHTSLFCVNLSPNLTENISGACHLKDSEGNAQGKISSCDRMTWESPVSVRSGRPSGAITMFLWRCLLDIYNIKWIRQSRDSRRRSSHGQHFLNEDRRALRRPAITALLISKSSSLGCYVSSY